MIEIGTRPNDRYYLDKTKIQEVIDELQANGFDVNPHYYNQAVPVINRLSFRSRYVEIIIQKGDFYHYLYIHLDAADYNNSAKIRFDCDGKTAKFDIEKVNEFYKKWYDRTEKTKIRENVSKFKGDLLLSYIRGKFDEFEIEYTQPRHEHMFETSTFQITYCEPTPSELVKLNMERVKVHLYFTNDNKEYGAEIYLIPFLKSPKENMEKIKEFINTRDSETETINSIYVEYRNQITKLETELRRVHELGTKLTKEKYSKSMKELFYPRKNK